MNASGQIAVRHVSQTILPGGTATTRFVGQNTSGSTLWLNSGDAASPARGSFELKPGQSFDSSFFPINLDLNACGEAGASFTLKHY